MVKLIAVDMDGTFLDDRGQFDKERFTKILDCLDQEEIHFVVATGNQVSRMEHVLGSLAERVNFVAGNGSHIVWKGQTQALKEIPVDDLQSFCHYFRDKFADYHIVISSPQETYMLEEAWNKDNLENRDSLAYYNDSFPGVILVTDSVDIPLENINKITLKVPMEELQTVLEELSLYFPNFEALTSGFGAIDLILPGIDKAWGLRRLLGHLQITPDQLMAFGDGENDLSMLEIAGHSYAMSNAEDKVKSVSKHIAPSNNEQGVLQVIEQYLEQISTP